MRWLSAPIAALEAQRGHLFPWVPVLLGAGIGIYFRLGQEPGAGLLIAAGAGALVLCVAAWRLGAHPAPLLLAPAIVLAGFALAGGRAHHVAAVKLAYPYYGPVEGRIIGIDRSWSDKPRLTLDQVVLGRIPPARTPGRVRISLHGDQGTLDPVPGMRIMLTGRLSPPRGPVEPGGFDFRRMAWFAGIGAVGYTRSPALAIARPEGGTLWLERFRARLSAGLRQAIGGDAGAFAAAILTGDRSGLDKDALAALRASNLAHLLAISGLHMGLLAGFVFAALRLFMALFPPLVLHWPTRRIAAAGALAAAAFYLALSGGNVATERAFVMVAVMLVAVILGRRALTLRAVALAALIVLLRRPEALTGPGFQMSFAATVALVAVFGALRAWRGWRLPRPLRPVAAVVISSAVAGAATAPIAAAHFNQLAHYGLLANLLSVPVMGVLVIPAAVMAALLWPFGGAWIGLEVMRVAILWILGVARVVAGMEGAVSHVPAPPPAVLPLLALGGLWLVLWQGRARLGGLAVMALALLLWAEARRPALLISESGRLVGLMGPEGRALGKARGDGFSARVWLENDGDGASQKEAAGRPGLLRARGEIRFSLGGISFVQLFGRGARARLDEVCADGAWIILAAEVEAGAGGGVEGGGERAEGGGERAEGGAESPVKCHVIDTAMLARTGPLALYPPPAGAPAPVIVSAREMAGERLWNTAGDARRAAAYRTGPMPP